MEELIKRLRAMARYEHDDLGMGNEAADALEAQQARIALLTCERDELRQFHDASLSNEGFGGNAGPEKGKQ